MAHTFTSTPLPSQLFERVDNSRIWGNGLKLKEGRLIPGESSLLRVCCGTGTGYPKKLQTPYARLDKVLGSLIYWVGPLPMAEGWN